MTRIAQIFQQCTSQVRICVISVICGYEPKSQPVD